MSDQTHAAGNGELKVTLQDAGSLVWQQPLQSGEIPNRRSGHTFTVIGTNGFLFGGIDHASPPGPSNDIYRLKLKNDAFTWSKINATGLAPLPRWRHTANVFDETSVVIFGGFHSSTNRFNDIHVLDTVSLSWTQPVEQQSDFTPRGNHIPKRMPGLSCPTPRGAHSSNIVGTNVHIWRLWGVRLQSPRF